MPKLLLLWLVVAAASVGLSAQQGTDFSGNWVLAESSASSELIPDRLTVRQPVTTTNALGKPVPPMYRTIEVTRHFANSVQEATYQIGVSGGVVGGLAGVPGPTSRSDWEVRWVGDALWINQRQFASGALASERSETWRLDDAGRLTITLEIRGSQIVDVRRWMLVYRRDGT